jgi:methylenetetrahydrofolate dehydrogenase (NADP+)/methenyltetrahydrofolate cyclohydrolase/formyltetrahydrofolate synthetase
MASMLPSKLNTKAADLTRHRVIRDRLKADIEQLKRDHGGFCPHLVIVQVGGREDSTIYVNMKKKAAEEAGIKLTLERLPETISQAHLLSLIQKHNDDAQVHGILVQLPLPAGFDSKAITEAVDSTKDVDGFDSLNMGNLALRDGEPLFVPCTPKGVIELLRFYNVPIAGKNAVVIGRSNIVGMPMFNLLVKHDATVTLCHSKTENLQDKLKHADIVVAAAGKPELVKGEWLKPGVVVIDVGTNAVPGR